MSRFAARKFQIAETPSQKTPELQQRSAPGLRFREERIKVPAGIRCELKWRDYYNKEFTARILDISKYGARILLPSADESHKLFSRIARAQVEIESAEAYSGPITFVNERQEADGSISLGLTFEQSGCDLDALSAATRVRSSSIESDLQRVLSISAGVRNEFKVLTSELNLVLQEISQKLDREEKHISETANSENHRQRLEERVISVAMSIYRPHLQALLSQFQDLVRDMSLDEEGLHKQYFRLTFHDVGRGTPFVDRGLRRPLGYAGDYGLMVMLYEYADQGATLFHRFFHRFVCMEPAAVANRNRVGFLSDIVLAAYDKALAAGVKEFRIASLACGPAREIYEFIKYAKFTSDVQVKIVLVDMEDHALDYAQARLKELAGAHPSLELIFLKEDVVTGVMQNHPFTKWLDKCDFIISAGLFDYLTERVSQRMITNLYPLLKTGGEILIGNISKQSPDIFAMDYFMDWRLILRDPQDLLKLVSSEIQNQGAKSAVLAEALGLNLFLQVKRDK